MRKLTLFLFLCQTIGVTATFAKNNVAAKVGDRTISDKKLVRIINKVRQRYYTSSQKYSESFIRKSLLKNLIIQELALIAAIKWGLYPYQPQKTSKLLLYGIKEVYNTLGFPIKKGATFEELREKLFDENLYFPGEEYLEDHFLATKKGSEIFSEIKSEKIREQLETGKKIFFIECKSKAKICGPLDGIKIDILD